MKRLGITMTAAAMMAVLLSGCETLDAYTGESKTSNATKGAIIGASLKR